MRKKVFTYFIATYRFPLRFISRETVGGDIRMVFTLMFTFSVVTQNTFLENKNEFTDFNFKAQSKRK